jgi:predicted HicB family RNase H-like nuclease
MITAAAANRVRSAEDKVSFSAREDEEMSKNTYPLKLPTSVKKAAAELATADGLSLNQFIAAAVAEKVDSLRAADERGPAIACLPFAICSDF